MQTVSHHSPPAIRAVRRYKPQGVADVCSDCKDIGGCTALFVSPRVQTTLRRAWRIASDVHHLLFLRVTLSAGSHGTFSLCFVRWRHRIDGPWVNNNEEAAQTTESS